MKQFAYTIAALAMMTLGSLATASPLDSGESILTSATDDATIVDQAPLTDDSHAPAPPAPLADVSNSAPMTHSSVAPTEVAPPIVSGTVVHQQPANVQRRSYASNRYYRPKKKQNMFGKLWEMEKKKNAWLKKKFLGM